MVEGVNSFLHVSWPFSKLHLSSYKALKEKTPYLREGGREGETSKIFLIRILLPMGVAKKVLQISFQDSGEGECPARKLGRTRTCARGSAHETSCRTKPRRKQKASKKNGEGLGGGNWLGPIILAGVTRGGEQSPQLACKRERSNHKLAEKAPEGGSDLSIDPEEGCWGAPQGGREGMAASGGGGGTPLVQRRPIAPPLARWRCEATPADLETSTG